MNFVQLSRNFYHKVLVRLVNFLCSKMKKSLIVLIGIAGLLMVGGLVAAEKPDHAGPSDEMSTWTNTDSIPEVDLVDTSGDYLVDGNDSLIRAQEEHIGDISVNVTEVNESMVMDITGPTGEENVSFFIQSDAVDENINGSVESADLLINGTESDFYVDEDAGPGQSPWIYFEVPHFSTQSVAFEADGDGPNETYGAEDAPDGIDSFLSTEPVGENETNDEDLHGKVRLSDDQIDTMDLVVNETSETEVSMTVSNEQNESATVYVQETAFEATTNQSVDVFVDGESVESGTVEEGPGHWIVFEIDHFSDRTVTLSSGGSDDGSSGGIFGIPIWAILGAVGAVVVVGGGLYYIRDDDVEYVSN